jgi:hypothetical protein
LPSQEVDFPSVGVGSADTGAVTFRQILVGPISLDKLTINDFDGAFQYSSGVLEGVRLEIAITPWISYWFEVGFDTFWGSWVTLFGSPNPSTQTFSTIDPGPFSLPPITLGNGKLTIKSKKITLGPLKMTPRPISSSGGAPSVNAIQTGGMTMKNVDVPTGLPALFGLTLPVPNPMGSESANIEDAQIISVSAERVSLPPITFDAVSAQNIQLDDVEADGFQAKGTGSASTDWWPDSPPSGDANGFGFQLGVDVAVTITVSKITMSGLNGAVDASLATTSPLRMSITIQGIDVDGIQVNKIQLPTVDLKV